MYNRKHTIAGVTMWPLLFLVYTLPLKAQTRLPPSGCQWGTATQTLAINNLTAVLTNTGSFNRQFLNAPASDPQYVAYAHALWLGGTVNNEIRIAGTQYGPYEFFPGPLDDKGEPPSDCSPFDHIYMVSREDLQQFDASGLATDDILNWPWQHGAEVIDGDGIVGNYNLKGGDRPRIFGDQTAFWLLNDRGNIHLWAQTEPLGLQVAVYAFAFSSPSPTLSRSSNPYLQHIAGKLDGTVFLRYVITYKGDAPLKDAWLGLWTDQNLGNFWNDLAGSDTTLHMAFGYDEDNGDPRFEGRPPAFGNVLLQGPIVKQSTASIDTLGMTNFMDIRPVDDGPRYGSIDAYLLMQSIWSASWFDPPKPATEGGAGIDGETPTRFMFPGDPVTGAYWSMENMDGDGQRYASSHDHRLLLSSGPFQMIPGDTQDILYAFVWARGADRLDSITQLRTIARGLHDTYPALIYAGTHIKKEQPDIPNSVSFSQAAPNPFRERTVIRYILPEAAHVQIDVYDMLGRLQATLVDNNQNAGTHSATLHTESLPAGVYFFRLVLNGYLTETRRVTLLP